MKCKLLLLGVIFFSTTPFAFGQITSTSIASHISKDTGSPGDQYLSYAENLARTLNGLTATQLHYVLDDYVPVGGTSAAYAASLSDLSFAESAGNAEPTLNEALQLDQINFAWGSTTLSSSAYVELEKVAEFLLLNSTDKILIEGHTAYKFDGDIALSEGRANSAKDYLIDLGIESERIEIIGLGATEPLIEAQTRSDHEVNKRIEIHVVSEEDEGGDSPAGEE